MEIYHKLNSVWRPKPAQKIKRESIRLLAYKNSYHLPYELKEMNQINQNIIKKYPVGNPSRCKKQPLYKLSHYLETLERVKLLRSNYNRSKPYEHP